MMSLHLLLAEATGGNGALDIINNSKGIAQEIDLAMSGTYIKTLTGPLYKDICNLGAGVMLLAGLYGLAATARAEMHKSAITPLLSTEKMIVIFALLLLMGSPVNRGKALGELSLFSHRQFHNIGNTFLKNTAQDIQYNVNQQAQTKIHLETIVPNEIEKCVAIDDIPKRNFCLQRLDDKLKGETEAYPQEGWAKQLYDTWHNEISESQVGTDESHEFDPLGDIGKASGSVIGGLGQGVAYLVIQGVLVSIGSAFIYGVTQVTLISYEILPVFFGLALFSEEYKSAKIALGGVAGLEGALILYKILNANIAQTVLNSPPNDPLLMPMVLAGLALGLSVALVAGGGLGILQIFASFGGRGMR
jgi:hypothetical protein